MAQQQPPPHPIIDSHIHLFPSTHLSTLAWMTPSNPLHAQHSLSEYRSSVFSRSPSSSSSSPSLLGFVFVETDRTSSLSSPTPSPTDDPTSSWRHVSEEISFVARVALGDPVRGEGHEVSDAGLCLGIVPWAPVPAGRHVMGVYVEKVKEWAGKAWPKIKGFRYLVQDKPSGTMGGAAMGEGLDFLAERGLTFDLGIDVRRGGLWQMREAVEMVDGIRARWKGEGDMVTIVINHMCKPDMTRPSPSEGASFDEWKNGIFALAAYPKSYMKLSGCFSEMPPQDAGSPWPARKIADHIRPWADVVLDAFGPRRTMFGSDWPVCNIAGAGAENAWRNWQAAVELLLEDMRLDDDEKATVWSGTAIKAYGLEG